MTLELGTRLGAYDAGGDSMPIIRGDEVAVDPSTGDLVVLVGGMSDNSFAFRRRAAPKHRLTWWAIGASWVRVV